jgi:hypothetical protein
VLGAPALRHPKSKIKIELFSKLYRKYSGHASGGGQNAMPGSSELISIVISIRSEIYYWSDFGSDLFLGDFESSRETSSCAQGGMPTFPSRIICLALNFLP